MFVTYTSVNITTWDRRRREEIDRFEDDAMFSYGLYILRIDHSWFVYYDALIH